MLDLGLTLLLVMASDAGAGEAKAQPTPSAAAADDRERMVCKREVRTGTLAGYRRVCHTRAEWTEIAHGTQDSWQQIQGAQGSTNERMAADMLTPK